MKKSFKLTVIMPVFNEAKTIAEIVGKVLNQKEVFELIIVDDCSTDGSRDVLKEYRSNKKVKILLHDKNRGKGAAILTGLEKASGDYVVIQDADLEYDPQDYQALIAPVIDGHAEVVYGSRFYGPHKNMLFWHKVANDLLNFTVDFLFDSTISDCETGYKLMPTKLMKDLNLTSNRFDFEIETTCKILKKGIRIYEVSISYFGREYRDGKKITFKDGVIAFLKVWQYRFL